MTTQPMPLEVALHHIQAGNRVETVISRTWRPGDPSRCGLCPAGYCSAGSGQLCQIRILGRVEPADAWLYKVERMDPSAERRPDDPRLAAREADPPLPINTRIAYVTHQGRTRTAIARQWWPEDAQRCRLCPDRCHASIADGGTTAMCLMVAPGRVPLADARTFAPTHFAPTPDRSSGDEPVPTAPKTCCGGGPCRWVARFRRWFGLDA